MICLVNMNCHRVIDMQLQGKLELNCQQKQNVVLQKNAIISEL